MLVGEISPGVVLADRYQVVRGLRAGGMGAVYEVLDQQTDRRRALKVMLANVAHDAELAARFKREATVTGRVESEHVVEVLDAGTDQGTGLSFLVMELLNGRDLGAELAEVGRFTPERVVECLTQVALGLSKTHAEGIVHRDLKLENLFLSRRDDGSSLIRLLDFGIAKVTSDTGPLNTTHALGTPVYMAPEQLRGDATIDARADLYSLAHLAFTLLVGSAYWSLEHKAEKSVYAFMTKVLAGAPEAASVRAQRAGVTLGVELDSWFARATALEPDDRYEHAVEQVAELAQALGLATPAALLQHENTLDLRSASVPPARESSTKAVAVRRALPSRAGLLSVVGIAALAAAVLLLALPSGPRSLMSRGLVAASIPLPRAEPTPPPAAAAPTPPVASSAEPRAEQAPPAHRQPKLSPAPSSTVQKPRVPRSTPYDPLDEL